MRSQKNLFLPLLISTFLLISCSKDENEKQESNTPSEMPCHEDEQPLFIEADGLIKVDIVNAEHENTGWNSGESIENFTGSGYLIWEGPGSMGSPGNGLLTYKIRIQNPGTYRFIWRSRITQGSSNTEHNDSWLRIPDASHFYGKNSAGHIVYPKETLLPPIPESEGQESTVPNGAGADGWFKVYMNTANNWKWQSSTSDHDAHQIFAVFNHPGIYTIEISGRSPGHGIDAFVLFNENYTQNEATADAVGFSEIDCQ